MLDSSVDLGLGAERARRHRRVPYRGESGAARPGEFQDIWIDPREAAGDIREGFGPEKAIGSLIGKEFLNVLEAADDDPDVAVGRPRGVRDVPGQYAHNRSGKHGPPPAWPAP